MMGDREKQIKHVLLIISDSLPNCSDFDICLGKRIAHHPQAFPGGASQRESEIPTRAHSCAGSRSTCRPHRKPCTRISVRFQCQKSLAADSHNSEKPCPLRNWPATWAAVRSGEQAQHSEKHQEMFLESHSTGREEWDG